jgi:RNA polymerase sigma factor (sigma-70 family)
VDIAKSVWQQSRYNLAHDFFDLLLPPVYPFGVEASYPKTASIEFLIKGHFDSLELPEHKLLRLETLMDESWVKDFPEKEADWATIFAYEVLQGAGGQLASSIEGASFEGLKQLARAWGSYLAREVERLFRRWQLFTAFADFTFDLFNIFLQISAKELGEAIRESITPAYIRAGETVDYALALFCNDPAKMKESRSILEASDCELEKEIGNMFSGYSTRQLGRQMQWMLVEVLSGLRDFFSSSEFRERFSEELPRAMLIVCKNASWYIGYCLSLNLRYNPQRTKGLLEAMGHHQEITAAIEQYRYKYGWQGDRDRAIRLAWEAIAPKYFGLPSRVEDIHRDEGEEKFIGVAQGLEGYANKNRAVDALSDGFLGRLGTYLKRAAKNQETDYVRKLKTDGNKILKEAQHAEDFRQADREGDEEQPDEEILSGIKQERCPSDDAVVEEVEAKETLKAWYATLTEQERTAIALVLTLGNEEEIAQRMGISQQRVSQLLRQARKKYPKI